MKLLLENWIEKQGKRALGDEKCEMSEAAAAATMVVKERINGFIRAQHTRHRALLSVSVSFLSLLFGSQNQTKYCSQISPIRGVKNRKLQHLGWNKLFGYKMKWKNFTFFSCSKKKFFPDDYERKNNDIVRGKKLIFYMKNFNLQWREFIFF